MSFGSFALAGAVQRDEACECIQVPGLLCLALHNASLASNFMLISAERMLRGCRTSVELTSAAAPTIQTAAIFTAWQAHSAQFHFHFNFNFNLNLNFYIEHICIWPAATHTHNTHSYTLTHTYILAVVQRPFLCAGCIGFCFGQMQAACVRICVSLICVNFTLNSLYYDDVLSLLLAFVSHFRFLVLQFFKNSIWQFCRPGVTTSICLHIYLSLSSLYLYLLLTLYPLSKSTAINVCW